MAADRLRLVTALGLGRRTLKTITKTNGASSPDLCILLIPQALGQNCWKQRFEGEGIDYNWTSFVEFRFLLNYITIHHLPGGISNKFKKMVGWVAHKVS